MTEWVSGNAGEYLAQRPGVVGIEQEHGREHERKITDAVGEKCPKRVTMRRTAAHILAQQEVQQNPDQVPRDQQRNKVTGVHHEQQSGCHQIKHRKKARVTFLLSHVAQGINVNDQADARNYERQQRAQRIDDKNAPGLRESYRQRFVTTEYLPQHCGRQKKRGSGTGHADPGSALREAPGSQDSEQRRHQRQCDQ